MVKQFSDASPGCLDGALVGLSQEPLELREHLLDGVQIGRVGRQEEQPDARRLEELAHLASLVAAEIVDDDDGARLQLGDQELLDLCGEAVAVDRPVEHARRDDAVVPEPGDEGQRLPMAVRHLVEQGLALGAPAMRARHVGLSPGLVDEDHAPRVYPLLEPEPALAAAGDIGPVLLLGEERLFLNVLPQRLR